MISAKGLSLIKRFEGFSPLEYTCIGGKRTIGYGHVMARDETFPCGVTEKDAAEILNADISDAERIVLKHVEVPLSQGQFDALVSFVFNVGERNFVHSTLLKELNSGHFDACPAEICRWIYARGQRAAGLIRRRKAEAEMFRCTDQTLF